MREKPKKYVPQFSEKFKLIEPELSGEPRGWKKQCAWRVFSTPKCEPLSAAVELSRCFAGKQEFPVDKLEIFLEYIHRRDALKGLTAAVWLGSLDSFRAAVAAAGIDVTESIYTPLSEQLRAIESTDDALRVLGGYPHTFDTSDEFQISLQLLELDDRRKVAEFFCRVIEESWGADGRPLQSAMVAGATVARIWPVLARSAELNRLNNWLEKRVDELSPAFAPLADAVCYFGALNDRHGAYRKNLERMIRDPLWRAVDYRRQLSYHKGHKLLGQHIGYHLMNRRAHPHILCNDIGRVISVYPELRKHKDLNNLSTFVKEETLKSMVTADISPSLRSGVEDLIERR